MSRRRRDGETGVRSYCYPLLFDNYIGRKRDVDGGFLAGFRWRLVSRERGWSAAGSEEILTVTFRNSSRRGAGGSERREMGRLAEASWRMCLELVENTVCSGDGADRSDQSGSDLIQLESLILAQNERWRQA